MTHPAPAFSFPSHMERRGFLGLMALPLLFPPMVWANENAQGSGPPNSPYITPEMLGWTEQTDPVETAAIINRALAVAVERGIPFFDNAVRRIGGTVRLGGKVVMEFGTKHHWIADHSDLSRFATVEQNLAAEEVADPRHVFVDTSGARGSILRGPMRLTGTVPRNMALASRRAIPKSLVALTATTTDPSHEISIEAIAVEGFGFGLYQGSQRGPRRKILPYTRLRVGTAVFRFCNSAIETGHWGNGLDDATFDILRISRCAEAGILRGTELNAISVFHFGLNDTVDAERAEVRLDANSNVAVFSGFSPFIGMVIAVEQQGGKPAFVAQVEQVDGSRAVLSRKSDADYAGTFVADPPSLILQNSAVNAMHYYLEGLFDVPLDLRTKSKLSINDLKISRGSFSGQGGVPVSVYGEQTSVDLHLNPRTADNPLMEGIVGLASESAQVGGRIMSGANLGATQSVVIDTRPSKVLGAVRQNDVSGGPSSAIRGYFANRNAELSIASQ